METSPCSESDFRENRLTSSIPIQHARNSTFNSQYTPLSNRNIIPNKFTNQESKQHFGINKSSKKSHGLETLTNLPIKPNKGPFFQDPYFQKCHRQFEKSMQDVLTKFGLSGLSSSSRSLPREPDMFGEAWEPDMSGEAWSQNLRSSTGPQLASRNSLKKDSTSINNALYTYESYRNLRDIQVCEENQAASLESGDHHHKIVIDVKDFMGGDVQVKSFNNIIRIEGSHETSSQSPSNSNSSKKNFSKEFTLPGDYVNMGPGAVKSKISSDGILTIIVPRSMYGAKGLKPASTAYQADTYGATSQKTGARGSRPSTYSRTSHGGYWK